jgi:hypothetical protein
MWSLTAASPGPWRELRNGISDHPYRVGDVTSFYRSPKTWL